MRHRDEIARLIRDLGFNNVRLAHADEIVSHSPITDPKVIAANEDLFQDSLPPRALDMFHAVVEGLTLAGLLGIVNNHSTQPLGAVALTLAT